MSERELYAGVDLGGTKILVLIANDGAEVLGSRRVATEAPQGPQHVVRRIVEAVRQVAMEAKVELSELSAVGISAPGPIDTVDGIITDPPNLPGWHNVPLGSILREHLNLPTVLENDANCAAIGEHLFGAGVGYRHMIYVTVSTGVGGGLIIENELYSGTSGAAGEVGHLVVAEVGPTCGAGHIGCLEAYASGTAIAARAREMVAAGELPLTAKLAEQDPPLSAKTVYQAGLQGEAAALALIERAGRFLGIGLASLINTFNPQAIVLGGGLMNMGDTILGPAVETARTRTFAQSFTDVRIVEGELGERGAALGAIAVAQSRYAPKPI
jgi:glucokinase